MNKTWIYTLITLFSIFVLSSCRKAAHEDVEVQKLSDVKVPEGFTWESSREVSFKVNVDAAEAKGIYVIAIYTADGKLLSKGAASASAAFESKLYLPAELTEVYVLKTNPDNSVNSKKVEVNANSINVSFSRESSAVSLAKNSSKALASGPDCSTGCTSSVVITEDDQVVNLKGGTVCIGGSNKRFKLKFVQGYSTTVRICGTNLTLNNVEFVQDGQGKEVIVTTNGSATFDNIVGSINSTSLAITNYGTLSLEGGSYNFFLNYGALEINANYPLFTTLSNYGNVTVNGVLGITGRGSSISNNGTITVNGNLEFDVNSAGNYYRNTCKTVVTGNLIVRGNSLGGGLFYNYGYLSIGNEMNIGLTGYLFQYPSSMITTKNLNINSGGLRGVDGASLIKVSGNTFIGRNSYYPVATVSGPVKICDANGIDTNEATLTNGASFDCNINIPVNACNPQGNGTMAATDADGDGISDNLDDYPNDANKAFNNPYPIGDASAGATVLFEDMWPAKGDYDLNDVVLSYNLKIITNSQNKVSGVDGTYKLRARGGIYQNGFGIEFPVDRSKVSNVAGGTLEEGQQKAVILLFNNMQAELGQMNTNISDPLAASKTYNLSFKITNGPTLTEFGLSEYNPFIWNKAKGRGYEIHLPNKKPTSLANASLFGTEDDGSVPSAGKYYVTKNGFPYAISIPVKDFVYPLEGKDIGTAYLKLAGWVASGGSSYTDWYSNQATGYRDNTNLFIK
jgi:LruC domain-containing protein